MNFQVLKEIIDVLKQPEITSKFAYVKMSAVKWLIMINRIQKILLYNICVCTVYIYYVYVNTHLHNFMFLN